MCSVNFTVCYDVKQIFQPVRAAKARRLVAEYGETFHVGRKEECEGETATRARMVSHKQIQPYCNVRSC